MKLYIEVEASGKSKEDIRSDLATFCNIQTTYECIINDTWVESMRLVEVEPVVEPKFSVGEPVIIIHPFNMKGLAGTVEKIHPPFFKNHVYYIIKLDAPFMDNGKAVTHTSNLESQIKPNNNIY